MASKLLVNDLSKVYIRYPFDYYRKTLPLSKSDLALKSTLWWQDMC